MPTYCDQAGDNQADSRQLEVTSETSVRIRKDLGRWHDLKSTPTDFLVVVFRDPHKRFCDFLHYPLMRNVCQKYVPAFDIAPNKVFAFLGESKRLWSNCGSNETFAQQEGGGCANGFLPPHLSQVPPRGARILLHGP